MENSNKKHSIISSAGVISSCTLVSRILGLVRDMIAASLFGQSWVWDIFIIAFIIPNMFRRFFGEGALSSAFIPVFSDYLKKGEEQKTFHFMSNIITILSILLCIVALIIMFGTFIVQPVTPKWILGGKLIRVLIWFLPIICVVAIIGAILNSFKHFFAPAFASVVLNLFWIGGFIVAKGFIPDNNKMVLIISWAIILGGVFELVMQIPFMIRKGIRYKPVINLKDEGLRQVVKLMLPMMFGLAIFQLNSLGDTLVAEFMVVGDGAVSALYYANRLMQFPLALIGVALGQASFPFFADLITGKDFKKAGSSITKTLRTCLFFAMPASFGLAVLSSPIIELLFYGGKFDMNSVSRASINLAYYAFAVFSYSSIHIITRVFYSFKEPGVPVRIGFFAVILNLILNVTFVLITGQEWGIALSTAISALVNFTLLLMFVVSRYPKLDIKIGTILKSTATYILGAVLMYTVCVYIIRMRCFEIGGEGVLNIKTAALLKTLVGVICGTGVYLVFVSLFNFKDIKRILKSYRRSS